MDTAFIPTNLLETPEYTGPGFQPMVDYADWRVALTSFTPTRPFSEFQRHDETDEVFVLLQGGCLLFVGEGGEEVTRIFMQEMEPFRLYNVKRGAWHTNILTPDARVLIVENQDTSPANSPRVRITSSQRMEMISLVRQAWGDDIPALDIG